MLRIAIIAVCALITGSGCADDSRPPIMVSDHDTRPVDPRLSGEWRLRIDNLQGQAITTLDVRFIGDPAESCMGGDWKQVVVLSHSTSDASFFPVSEPLSYELENDKLTIGRNRVCDAYLHLTVDLSNPGVSGNYRGFGLGSGKLLGHFTLLKYQ